LDPFPKKKINKKYAATVKPEKNPDTSFLLWCTARKRTLVVAWKIGNHFSWSPIEVYSLTFQSENSRSGLNRLCLAMALVEVLFRERRLSSGWKTKIFDRMTALLVHCSLLGDISFGEARFQVLSWWWMYYCFMG
jgi:hypothetical protein